MVIAKMYTNNRKQQLTSNLYTKLKLSQYYCRNTKTNYLLKRIESNIPESFSRSTLSDPF